MTTARRVGVCSWSLQPVGPDDLASRVRDCGLRCVQLHLDPIRHGDWSFDATVGALAGAGVEVFSGMMSCAGEDYSTLNTIRLTGGLRPDATWQDNMDAAFANATVARRLGLSLVTMHAGFLPHDPADPLRSVLIGRLRTIADIFGSQGLRLGLETGQESPETLLDVLHELSHPGVGVNFDPANIILYGMGDPIAALRALRDHVLQVHVKDAVAAGAPGEWGTEVPVGTGGVAWDEFFAVLETCRPHGKPANIVIEREAGDQRVEDVRIAAELVRRHTGGSAE